jgi:inositol-phosphate phosphatase / L-galactose 1-phosphate phosphatase / histidinol-phosphatase
LNAAFLVSNPDTAVSEHSVDTALIALAERLADASGPVARHYFRTPLAIDDKSDDSPVTRADREAEAAIRRIIEAERPTDGILGEEHGAVRTDAEYVWVLDPIDGTRAFINGLPVFGTLIALTRHGAPILGVIDMPALGDRWTGACGHPTRFASAGNGAGQAHVRACATLAAARLCATTPDMFNRDDRPRFTRMTQAVRDTRYGTDCIAYGLLASGHTDLVVEAGMQPYDYLAQVPIIEGAGGTITDWQGKPLTLESKGDVVAAGDARVHREALAVLAAG